MSGDMPQPSPVVFFPPALDTSKRIGAMDFRPLPVQEIPKAVEEEVAEDEVDDNPNPKGSSAQESAPSSASVVVPPSTQSPLPIPATIVPAAKDNGKPKVSEPSTPVG